MHLDHTTCTCHDYIAYTMLSFKDHVRRNEGRGGPGSVEMQWVLRGRSPPNVIQKFEGVGRWPDEVNLNWWPHCIGGLALFVTLACTWTFVMSLHRLNEHAFLFPCSRSKWQPPRLGTAKLSLCWELLPDQLILGPGKI